MDLPAFGATTADFATAVVVGLVMPWIGPLFALTLACELVWVAAKWAIWGGKRV